MRCPASPAAGGLGRKHGVSSPRERGIVTQASQADKQAAHSHRRREGHAVMRPCHRNRSDVFAVVHDQAAARRPRQPSGVFLARSAGRGLKRPPAAHYDAVPEHEARLDIRRAAAKAAQSAHRSEAAGNFTKPDSRGRRFPEVWTGVATGACGQRASLRCSNPGTHTAYIVAAAKDIIRLRASEGSQGSKPSVVYLLLAVTSTTVNGSPSTIVWTLAAF